MINLKTKSPNILVIGDLILDHYLFGSCNRISPEAPVQIVNIDQENISLGGAGNVVKNLHALGAIIDVISVIGDCETSRDLSLLLTENKINTSHLIFQKGRISSKKSRIISSHQQVVRYDVENTEEITKDTQEKIIKKFKLLVSNYDLILLSDYGKGVLTHFLTQSIIQIANKHNIKTLIDPKGSDYSKYNGAYLLTPNKKEASEATKIDIIDKTTLKHAIKTLKDKCNLKVSLITLSEEGVATYTNKLKIYPTSAREVFDVTGAGDTILASLGYAISIGMKINNAVKFSNLAAGIVVRKMGAATASLNEIIEYDSKLNKSSHSNYIKSLEEINSICNDLKLRDKKIVFTNGCFDILHIGHVKYLEEAKNLGDTLIVGVNSDNSVKKLKGNHRPINSDKDRAFILSSLEVVDYVIIFNEDTPLELIKKIKPNILVKGGDYANQKVVGENIADELKIIKFIEGMSTSKLINKIRKAN
jgi:D-beta-D-heptose 7-phosphate kinase / D-beta-D-heptose 1-phosphate adenosyltransferase